MLGLLKYYIKKMSPETAITELSTDYSYRTINGSFQVSQCTVDEKLRINGAATLGENTIVKKAIVVNGQLKAIGAVIEDDLFANGTADISNSSLKRKAHFSGNLTAKDCQFSGSLVLLAHKASFIHCHIYNAIIQELPYIKTSQIIHLSNGCEISGDITFEAGNGEVCIDKSSAIHGNVHGGKIIYI